MKIIISAGVLIAVLVTLPLITSKKAESADPVLVEIFFVKLKEKDTMAMEKILKEDPKVIAATDSMGFTPLIHATRYGEPEMVKFLLSHKANVNQQAEGGGSPLYHTVEPNKIENAKLLLKAKADPNLKEYSQSWAALPCAAYYGHLEMMKLLLDHGADVNITGKYNQTALHWSMRAISWRDQKEIVQLLIERGVNINHKDAKGKTALSMAKNRSSKGVIELLKKHGAK